MLTVKFFQNFVSSIFPGTLGYQLNPFIPGTIHYTDYNNCREKQVKMGTECQQSVTTFFCDRSTWQHEQVMFEGRTFTALRMCVSAKAT